MLAGFSKNPKATICCQRFSAPGRSARPLSAQRTSNFLSASCPRTVFRYPWFGSFCFKNSSRPAGYLVGLSKISGCFSSISKSISRMDAATKGVNSLLTLPRLSTCISGSGFYFRSSRHWNRLVLVLRFKEHCHKGFQLAHRRFFFSFRLGRLFCPAVLDHFIDDLKHAVFQV